MYAVWIKIDDTLPWIELKGEYPTRRSAKRAAKDFLNHAAIKIVEAPGHEQRVKSLMTARATR